MAETNDVVLKQIMEAVRASADSSGKIQARACYAALADLADRNGIRMTNIEETVVCAFRAAIMPGGFLDLQNASDDDKVSQATTALLLTMITTRLAKGLEAQSN